MNNMLLITRPKYDDGTEYLSYYASLIIKEASRLGIVIKDFEGKNVTYDNINKFISKKNPKLLFINGHGNQDSLEGTKGETIFSTTKNISVLKDRIIYARACYAGISLGQKMVQSNNGCFIGYKLPFSFWIDEKHSAIPSKDRTAALFLEPSNEIISSLINRHTAESSNERSKKMMIKNMKKVLIMEEKKEPGAIGLLDILWNNYTGQVILGNKEANF